MRDAHADRESATHAVNEWDQFLDAERPDIGFKQSLWWAEFQRTRGWESFGVVARDGDAICGGATVLVKSFAPGKSFYYIPHGPVLPDQDQDAAELFDDVMTFVDDRRKVDSQVISHLRIEPRWLERPAFVHGFSESISWHEPRNTICVDLRPAEDDILSRMTRNGRYNVRLARRNGVSIVEDTSSSGLDDFLSLYGETTSRQGIRRHSADYFRTLATTLFSSGRASIFFAEYQGVRLVTALIIYSGDTATYKYAGSLISHRNVKASELLQFEIMRKAKAKGRTWYDLGGVSPPDDPDSDWDKFSAFKRKFGGRELSFIPALDLVYDPDAYQQYRDLKSREHSKSRNGKKRQLMESK